MSNSWDLGADDPFGDETPIGEPVDGLVDGQVDGQVEWLAGTSWRAALDLPLELPLFSNEHQEMPTTEFWEVEE